jgi:hypothetical protein
MNRVTWSLALRCSTASWTRLGVGALAASSPPMRIIMATKWSSWCMNLRNSLTEILSSRPQGREAMSFPSLIALLRVSGVNWDSSDACCNVMNRGRSCSGSFMVPDSTLELPGIQRFSLREAGFGQAKKPDPLREPGSNMVLKISRTGRASCRRALSWSACP